MPEGGMNLLIGLARSLIRNPWLNRCYNDGSAMYFFDLGKFVSMLHADRFGPADGRGCWDRQARMDQLDRADRTEPMLATEPTESTEASEPAEPIDRIEPADPMDRIEPVDPMDKMDPLEPMLRIDPAEPRRLRG